MQAVLSVGVIGTGGIAQSHINTIENLENIQLIAVMDIDAKRAEDTAVKYEAKAYNRLEDLLANPEIQAVHICTPHSFHADQVISAAEANKHVMVEKPMALTIADCNRMIAACDRSNKILMVGQVMRHYPVNLRIRELLTDGTIGKVGHLMRRRLSYFDPSQGASNYQKWYLDLEIGGICVLYCFGPHEYDILPWYLNSPVEEVYATGTASTKLYQGQKDSYTTMMTHQNGTVSVLSQSVVCHTSTHDQYIIGSQGSIMSTNQKLILNGEEVLVEGSASEGMKEQIKEFANCCLTNQKPDANGRSVRHTMAVIEAAKYSAERKEPVQVSEFEIATK